MEVIDELIALAKEVMGDDQLKVIATELITKVRGSVTIDWQYREGARAKIRVLVKRILKNSATPRTFRKPPSKPCFSR
jgi:type I restriction enzyme R subunit